MLKPLISARPLAFLALAVALTGCPSVETGAKNDSQPTQQPTPQPTATPGEGGPALRLTSLGPIRARLVGTPEAQTGGITARVSSLTPYYGSVHVGYLQDKDQDPPESYDYFWNLKLVDANTYQVANDNDKDTHFYKLTSTQVIATLREFLSQEDRENPVFTLGAEEVEPLAWRPYGDQGLDLDFPAGIGTDLRFDVSGSELTILEWTNIGYYTTRKTGSISPSDVSFFRTATLNVTVEVEELDGKPTTNLTAANFAVEPVSWKLPQPTTIRVTETEQGRYVVSLEFRYLEGLEPEHQQLVLKVKHASLTHRHQEETL